MIYPSLLDPVIPAYPRHGDSYPIAQIYAAAKAERHKIEALYDEAITLSVAGRAGFSSTADSSQIYDEVVSVAVGEFASNVQAGIMPNFSRWASHMVGILIEDPTERANVRSALELVDGYLFNMINSSNANSEVHESLLDLALGTGCLRVDKGPGEHPLNVRSVPIRSLCFTTGSDGKPDCVFEERELYPSAWDIDYPDIDLPPDLDKYDDVRPPAMADVAGQPGKLKGVESWQRDWTEPSAHKWICRVFFPQHNNHIGLEYDKRGVGCSPYVGPFRWSKGSGEDWGRGPLVNLLPALRTVNYAMSALIDHADFALAGVYTYDDDGILNPDTIRLEPGALIPRAPGSRGLENLRPGADFNIQQFMLEDKRKAIRQGLYTDELGDPNRSPKTATEVQQRMANLARRIGSPFGRLIMELIIPFVHRSVYVLKDQGLIKMPTVDGQKIALIPTSPLAQAQRFDDIDAIDRYTAIIRDRFGTEGLNLVVDIGETADYLADRFPVPQRLLRPKDVRDKLIEQMTEAVASGQGQSAGLGGEVIPARLPAPATGGGA